VVHEGDKGDKGDEGDEGDEGNKATEFRNSSKLLCNEPYSRYQL